MSTDLSTSKVLIATTAYGTESAELTKPLEALRDAGATVEVASVGGEPVQTLEGDKEPSSVVSADLDLADADPGRYDALVLPGGTVNADTLRVNEDAQRIVKAFAAAGKPIAAICHAPWTLVNAGLVRGKTLTSYPSLRVDVENAGGNWKDEEVVVCDAEGFRLITSRNPGDLDAFNAKIAETLG